MKAKLETWNDYFPPEVLLEHSQPGAHVFIRIPVHEAQELAASLAVAVEKAKEHGNGN